MYLVFKRKYIFKTFLTTVFFTSLVYNKCVLKNAVNAKKSFLPGAITKKEVLLRKHLLYSFSAMIYFKQIFITIFQI